MNQSEIDSDYMWKIFGIIGGGICYDYLGDGTDLCLAFLIEKPSDIFRITSNICFCIVQQSETYHDTFERIRDFSALRLEIAPKTDHYMIAYFPDLKYPTGKP